MLKFGVPEYIFRARFALSGNMSGESPAPGLMPYNSTIWLNGSEISLSAPFVDVGHGCSRNSGFGSLGNCVCYKGVPISLDLLGEDRAICNTAPGYVWGFSSYLARLGLALEATWMCCCLICYLCLSLRGGLVRKKNVRTAGAIKLSLEFSEAVCGIEENAVELSEDGLKRRLKRINVGYRPASTSVLGGHGGLRYRVVAKERVKDLNPFTDVNMTASESAVRDWVNGRQPPDSEVYEDLNWDIYHRRRL